MFDIALMLHVIAAVIWVGGMFFAYICLRPATSLLQTSDRLILWNDVLARFFPIVWACIFIIFASGFYLIYFLSGFNGSSKYINSMMLLGFVMLFIFKFVYIKPYKNLRRFVAEQQWPEAAIALNTIRQCIAINLVLGLLTFFVAIALKVW